MQNLITFFRRAGFRVFLIAQKEDYVQELRDRVDQKRKAG